MSNTRHIIIPGREAGGRKVRNLAGKPLPCCWSDCAADGDDRYRIEIPHEQPRFPGEKLIYIYCSPGHRAFAAAANDEAARFYRP